MKTCIIEDDADFRFLIETWLELSNHQVQSFNNVRDALEKLDDDVDCVLIDWHFGATTAESTIRALRETRGWDFSIIVLTGSAADNLVVTALQAGADDFIIKPVQMSEMLARISACSRRRRQEAPIIQRGPFSLDISCRQLYRDGQPVKLTLKEFELARMLFQHPNRPLSRDFILARIWGHTPNDRTIDTHVSSLRAKLRLAETEISIASIPKYGYQLTTR